jgi:hypothetical protein
MVFWVVLIFTVAGFLAVFAFATALLRAVVAVRIAAVSFPAMALLSASMAADTDALDFFLILYSLLRFFYLHGI